MQRGGCAIADYDHIWLVFGKLFQELVPAFSRRFTPGLNQAESIAGITGGCICAPAEVPKGDITIGKLGGSGKLDPTGILLALDKAIPEEDYLVSFREIKASR